MTAANLSTHDRIRSIARASGYEWGSTSHAYLIPVRTLRMLWAVADLPAQVAPKRPAPLSRIARAIEDNIPNISPRGGTRYLLERLHYIAASQRARSAQWH